MPCYTRAKSDTSWSYAKANPMLMDMSIQALRLQGTVSFANGKINVSSYDASTHEDIVRRVKREYANQVKIATARKYGCTIVNTNEENVCYLRRK